MTGEGKLAFEPRGREMVIDCDIVPIERGSMITWRGTRTGVRSTGTHWKVDG